MQFMLLYFKAYKKKLRISFIIFIFYNDKNMIDLHVLISIKYIKQLNDYLDVGRLKMERLNFKKERLKFRLVNRCQTG